MACRSWLSFGNPLDELHDSRRGVAVTGRAVTFVELSGPGAADAIARSPSRDGLIVNVTWLGAANVDGIRSIREFSDTEQAQREARELMIAAREITLHWLSGRASRWPGVHTAQLVEDPLGVSLTELGLFTASVKACLLATGAASVTLAGSRTSSWLPLAAQIASALGVRTDWHPPFSFTDATQAVRRRAWPLISPLAHFAARKVREVRSTGAGSRPRPAADYLIVPEYRREDHLNSLDRVARALGGRQEWVLPWNPEAVPPMKEWLADKGYAALALGDYYARRSVAAETTERIALWAAARDGIEEALRTRLPDKAYAWPVFRSVLLDASWRMAPRADALATAAQDLLRDRRPKAILLMSDYNYISRLVAVAARSENIPTVQLQHGIRAGPDDNTIWGIPVLANKLALWNEYSGRWYTRHHTPTSRLSITGNPRYDCFSEPIPEADRLDGDSNRRILIITNALPIAQTLALLAATRKAVHALPFPVEVVIKTHPYESVEDVLPLVGDWGDTKVSVRRHGDSTALVRQASLVVAITSSVVFEAMLAGCPVVLLAYPDFDRFEYHPDTPLLVAGDETRAVAFISRVLNDQAYAADCRARCLEYSAAYWPLCGAGAAQRVAELMRNLAGFEDETNH